MPVSVKRKAFHLLTSAVCSFLSVYSLVVTLVITPTRLGYISSNTYTFSTICEPLTPSITSIYGVLLGNISLFFAIWLVIAVVSSPLLRYFCDRLRSPPNAMMRVQ